MAVSSQDFSLWSPDIPSICGLFWTQLHWKLFSLQVSLWCGFSCVSNFSLLRNQSIVMDSGYSAQFLYKRTVASECLVATEIHGARYCMLVMCEDMLKGSGGTNYNPLYALGLDACLYRSTQKWNGALLSQVWWLCILWVHMTGAIGSGTCVDLCLPPDRIQSLHIQRLQCQSCQKYDCYYPSCLHKACCHHEELPNWYIRCSILCSLVLVPTSISMGSPYFPLANSNSHDHSINCCISGLGK